MGGGGGGGSEGGGYQCGDTVAVVQRLGGCSWETVGG